MPQQRKPRAFVLALAALAALALAAPTASAEDAEYKGISEDGGVAVFSTTESLVAGDTDILPDVYVRSVDETLGDYVTREVSLGPTGGNDSFAAQYLAIDPAGQEVFFSTRERLTADDKDTATDIYVRDLIENKTSLVSVGDSTCSVTGCGEANVDVSSPGAEGIVDGGRRVFFVSTERLSSEDTDNGADVYLRDLDGERTRLVSVAAPSCGGCGAETEQVVFQDASGDGTKAIFTTTEPLTGGDKDKETDLYERDIEAIGGEGETNLVTTPGGGLEPCGGNCKPSTSSIADDGSHVFFETGERIAPIDTDTKQDVYDWFDGTAELASVGSADQNGGADARFLKSSANGGEVFFATVDSFALPDEDSVEDVYVRTGGASTELVSEGDASCSVVDCGNGPDTAVLEWVSDDGSLAILVTAEQLTAADTDANADVYSRELPGGPTALVSLPGPSCTTECGNGEHDASFSGASSDGTDLFFVTEEALAPPEPEDDPTAFGDGDKETDVYGRSAETTSLISLGQQDEVKVFMGNEEFPAQLRGVSATGARTFFTTDEQLTETDEDSDKDVYQRFEGSTLLVSRKNKAGLEAKLAPADPTLESTDPESPSAATSLRVIGSGPAETSIKLYATSQCAGAPVATGTVGQLEEPGLAVSVATGSTTTFHATAEASGFVSSCSGGVTYVQQGEGGLGGGGSSQPPQPKLAPDPGPLLPLRFEVPQTRITFGPAFKTRIRRPVFRFTDATGQQGTRFVCKVDHGRWKSCGSPLKLKKLSRGRHSFGVKGVNAVGVWQDKPSKRKFTVVP
jgi:hypothetical protein